MLIPVRCFTCNKIIGDKWDAFVHMRENKISYKEIFEKLHIHRWCCKRMLLSHFDIADKISQYNDKHLKNVTITDECNLSFIRIYRTI